MKRLFLLLTLAFTLTAVSCASAAALDKEEAKGIALEHAGIAEEQTSGLHLEYDKDGKTKKFEIEFRVEGDEYEYEIDADSGEVLKAEKNDRNLLKGTEPTEAPTADPTKQTETGPTEPVPTEPAPSEAPTDTTPAPTDTDPAPAPTESTAVDAPVTDTLITADEAKEIALRDACVSEADIRELEVELDRERGLTVYEIDFDYERMEYSYDIDAVSGEILKKEIDR